MHPTPEGRPSPDTTKPSSHIEPSEHSTAEVDEFLQHVEDNVERAEDAGSPAIKPTKELDSDGKPVSDVPRNERI